MSRGLIMENGWRKEREERGQEREVGEDGGGEEGGRKEGRRIEA